MKLKTLGKLSDMNIDLSTTYDQIDLKVKTGFDATYIGWIMQCVKPLKCDVLVNKEAIGSIILRRRLIQRERAEFWGVQTVQWSWASPRYEPKKKKL